MTFRTIRAIIEDQEIVSAPGSATVREAARLMKEQRVGALLVVTDGKLAGVFTERDVMSRVVAEDRDPRATRSVRSSRTSSTRCCGRSRRMTFSPDGCSKEAG